METAAPGNEKIVPQAFGIGKTGDPEPLITDAENGRLFCRLDALLPEIGAAGQRRILAENTENGVEKTELQGSDSQQRTEAAKYKNVILRLAGDNMPIGMKPMIRATTAAVVMADVADCDATRL